MFGMCHLTKTGRSGMSLKSQLLRTRYQQGCPAIASLLWRRHPHSVRQTVVGVIGGTLDPADIDGAVQDTWLRDWQARDRYDSAQPFGPWVRTIARTAALTRLRR